ncbi:hypothetical protein AK830_g11059 [Neonectria ditissima]|uniref:Uncharacterized protein n=1 Tax=Neonectria ditissima TaxID=78410 RepID=A0A0P7B916_9HYPO|nr:hypothetical protein AK830_g11059 [Neonectria ditissima]
MRIFSLLSLAAIAYALPAALVPGDQSNAAGLALRGGEVAAIANRSPESKNSARSENTIVARAIYESTFAWPEETFTGGSLYYQFQVTPIGDGKYTVGFWNSGPRNGYSYKYTVAAVGAGNDGTSITRTLSPPSSTSVQIQKSGTQYRITIDQA